MPNMFEGRVMQFIDDTQGRLDRIETKQDSFGDKLSGHIETNNKMSAMISGVIGLIVASIGYMTGKH